MIKGKENTASAQKLSWEGYMLIKENTIHFNNIRIKKLEKQVNKLLS